MRIGSRRTTANPADFLLAFLTTFLMITVLSGASAYGQARGDMRPAEQVFKNVQSLKGIPADEFMSTMGFFSASLGISCGDCHTAESGGDWAKYADDSDRKRRTRGMIAMVNTHIGMSLEYVREFDSTLPFPIRQLAERISAGLQFTF